MVGKALNSDHEDRFTFTLVEPKRTGESWSFGDQRKAVTVDGVRYILGGLFYGPPEKEVVGSVLVARNTGLLCLVENLPEKVSGKLTGYYFVGLLEDFRGYAMAKDRSKFGSCTLTLK